LKSSWCAFGLCNSATTSNSVAACWQSGVPSICTPQDGRDSNPQFCKTRIPHIRRALHCSAASPWLDTGEFHRKSVVRDTCLRQKYRGLPAQNGPRALIMRRSPGSKMIRGQKAGSPAIVASKTVLTVISHTNAPGSCFAFRKPRNVSSNFCTSAGAAPRTRASTGSSGTTVIPM
jgi:hypothetical protein